MRNIFVIVGRELRAYFASPIAYAVLTIFAFVSAGFFAMYLSGVMQMAQMRAMQGMQMGAPSATDVPAVVIEYFLNTMAVILLFLTPMLTMALFSEEKKRGTIELLLTSPITDVQIVLGKFLAAVTFFAILLLTTWLPVAFLYIYGDPVSGPMLTAYLGVLLYGLAIVSIGMFISTVTENQIVAAMISFGVSLVLWIMPGFTRLEFVSGRPALKGVLEYLSLLDHLNDFLKGILSTTHVIFYLSLTLFGLFLTYRSIDSLRWRG
jgi:ABC-2 type transport system permease protein